jgi:hypothetical protein
MIGQLARVGKRPSRTDAAVVVFDRHWNQGTPFMKNNNVIGCLLVADGTVGHGQSLSGLDSEWQPSPTGYTERHLAVCSRSVPQGTDCEQQKLLAQAVGPSSFRRLVKLEWQLY